jgi:hypothetical protein
MRFEKKDFLRFQIIIFKNTVLKWFMFYDLVQNHTYCLRNYNPKHTLYIYIYSHTLLLLTCKLVFGLNII